VPGPLTPVVRASNVEVTSECNRLQEWIIRKCPMVTVYDIARQAGVSTATVSRVLHGSSLVRPETRQRVVDVIERLGFVPNGSAQGLSMRRKDIIGLVALERGADEIDIERSSQLYVDEIVHAVEGVLRGTEISLLLSFGPRGESFQRRIQTLSGKVDGLLMAEDVLPASQLVALAERVPLVLIARSADATGLDALTVDNAGGIRAAVTHLTGVHGYRRLCFVGGPPDSPDAKQRLAAFGEAVRAADGCNAGPTVHGDFSEASGSAAARALLARGAEPEAVVCANDQMAIGLMREFRRSGIDVPGRVAVTGFDDIYPARLTDPPLTTVSQPLRELGTRAARRLLERIGAAALPAVTEALPTLPAVAEALPALPAVAEVLPTHLVVRGSCGCRSAREG
jgi:LacI family transcriptional regulator